MSGLDTRGLIDGAIKGFTLVDRYYDKEEAKARQKELDAQAVERYEQGQENWQKSFDASQAHRESQLGLQRQRLDQDQKNADRNYGLSQARLSDERSHRAFQRSRQAKEDARLAAERQKADELKLIQSAWVAIENGGDLTDDEVSAIQKHPHLNPVRYLDPKFSESVDYFSNRAGDIRSDDDLIRVINEPNSRAAFNAIYQDQLNRGDGDNKRVNLFAPMPGKPGQEKMLGVQLAVDGPDGAYEAPLSKNRSSDPNDPVKGISVKQAMDQISGMARINQLMKDPETRARFAKAAQRYGMLATSKDAGEWKKGEGGTIFHNQTGESKALPHSNTGLKMPDRDKEELKNLRSREKALRENLTMATGENAEVLRGQLDHVVSRMNEITRGESSAPKAKLSVADMVAKVRAANKGMDEETALKFLKHKGYISE